MYAKASSAYIGVDSVVKTLALMGPAFFYTCQDIESEGFALSRNTCYEQTLLPTLQMRRYEIELTNILKQEMSDHSAGHFLF